jgi:hypothetical protein
MDVTSRDIFAKKKEAFKRGDAEIMRQVGRGKDIMSILREQYRFADVWMLMPFYSYAFTSPR